MPFIQPFIHASIFYPPPTHLPFPYLSTHPPINFLLSFYSSFPYPPTPSPTYPSIHVPKYPHPSTHISSHTHLPIRLPYIFLHIHLPSHPLFSPSSHPLIHPSAQSVFTKVCIPNSTEQETQLILAVLFHGNRSQRAASESSSTPPSPAASLSGPSCLCCLLAWQLSLCSEVPGGGASPRAGESCSLAAYRWHLGKGCSASGNVRWSFVFNEELLPCPLCGEPCSFFLPPCLCDPGWTLRPVHRNQSWGGVSSTSLPLPLLEEAEPSPGLIIAARLCLKEAWFIPVSSPQARCAQGSWLWGRRCLSCPICPFPAAVHASLSPG